MNSDTLLLVYLLAFVIAMTVVILQVLWALRVMRALELSASSAVAGVAQIDAMRTAIVMIERRLRGEPEPPPARPRHSPKL